MHRISCKTSMNQSSWQALSKARKEGIQTLCWGRQRHRRGLQKPLPRKHGSHRTGIQRHCPWPTLGWYTRPCGKGGKERLKSLFLSKTQDPAQHPRRPFSSSLLPAMQISIHKCLSGHTSQPGLFRDISLFLNSMAQLLTATPTQSRVFKAGTT